SGKPQVRHIPLPQFTEATVNALLETKAVPVDAPDATSRISGGFGQAQMGWAYLILQMWGESAHNALHHLPHASGFAIALLHLQAQWQDHPHLLRLLNVPFTRLETVPDERDTLASAFTDILLRIELERSLRRLGELGLTDLARELDSMGIRRV